jgi:hypothetical protein
MIDKTLTLDEQRRRRAKNLAVGLGVAGLCLLFYVMSIVRMGAGGSW